MAVKAKPRPSTSYRLARKTTGAMVEGFRKPLHNLTRAQLRKVIETAKEFNETNCEWSEYWCKQLIARFAEDQLDNLIEYSKPKKKGK